MKKPLMDSDYGSGKFGKWGIDQFQLPIYEYTCMQTQDPIAKTNTSGKESIDHWHQVGNDRITLTAHNGGYMQFFIADRGTQWLSFYSPERKCLGGGICFIEENRKVWSDLYSPKLNTPPNSYKRIFGCGYFQKIMEKNELHVEHFIYPPFGNDPVVISEIKITNKSNQVKKISVYEFWGIKIKGLIGSLLTMLYMTKDRTKFGDSKPVSFLLRSLKNLLLTFGLGSEQIRDRFGSKFSFESHFSNSERCLILIPKYKPKIPVKKDQRADWNFYLNPIFLASFEKVLPVKYFNRFQIKKTNTTYKIHRSYDLTTDSSPALKVGHELSLNPQETKCLHFIFGTAPREEISQLIEKYENRIQDEFKAKNFQTWKENSLHFSVKDAPWLTREALWHSYYLRSAALFDEYYRAHYFPQGNAYLFLHGFNGAIRDCILFTLPMIYLNPSLAREMLEYIFRTMSAEGELPYAMVGVGKQMGAIVHETSSDLHLFLLWGLIEYLYITRDFPFLEKPLPFYPLELGKSSTVLERVFISLQFLFQRVGMGEHGLIKVGSGDWSDGISLLVKNRGKFLKQGESTFNSAFALYILPHVIALLQNRTPRKAAFLKQKYEEIRAACLKTWNGRWFYRGWEDTKVPVGDKNLFLEHHPWLLLSDVPLPHQAKILINNIHKFLDLNSRTGQYILYPPINVLLNILPRGWDVNGGIWHAMNFLLTWAYSKYDKDKAYQSLVKNSMATRSEIYPHIWYGIWSGSDSYNAEYASNPGQTFIHPATPQTDFPIMNLNLHAGFLNSLIKLVGITPTFDGLIIDPKFPQKEFKFQTPTFALEISNTEIKGFYKPVRDDHCLIRVRKPGYWGQQIKAFINGIPETEHFMIEGDWLILNVKIPETGLIFSFQHF